MDTDDFMKRLEQSFGTDHSKWPKHTSDEMVKWNVRNVPPRGPETKTMQELQEELRCAQQTLDKQLNSEIRTMFILDCESDVFQCHVRLERMRQKNESE